MGNLNFLINVDFHGKIDKAGEMLARPINTIILLN